MEKKQKNSIVTFMMVVGVIFILTAGCIFVRQAWEYLPETVKHICLLVVAVGALTGSALVAKSDTLRKTEAALFYIGDAFLGYFVLSVTGGTVMTQLFELNFGLKLFVATVFMMLPVGFRLVKEQGVADYIVSVVLANLAVIFATAGAELSLSVYIAILAVMTLVLLVVSLLIKDNGEWQKNVKICAKVCYLVQEVYALLCMLFLSFLALFGETMEFLNFTFVVIAFCIVLSTLICYDRKESEQIVQMVVTCVLMGNMLFLNLIRGELTDALVLGIVALVILIVAAVRNHKAYVIISSVTLLLIGFYITRSFWLSIAWWVYMFVAGVIMVLFAVKKEKEGE